MIPRKALTGCNVPCTLPVLFVYDHAGIFTMLLFFYDRFVTCRIPTRIRTAPNSSSGVSGSFKKSAPANMEQRVVNDPKDDICATDIFPAA